VNRFGQVEGHRVAERLAISAGSIRKMSAAERALEVSMRSNILGTIISAAAVLAAGGLLSTGVLLRPASAGIATAIRPDTNVTCTNGSPCEQYRNEGTGPGLEGVSGNGIGLLGQANKSGIGVSAIGTDGSAVQANSSDFVGINDTGGFTDTQGNDYPALSLVASFAGTTTFGDDLIDGCKAGTSLQNNACTSSVSVFRLDTFGDIGTVGKIQTTGDGLFGNSLEVGGATSPSAGDINITGEYLQNSSCVAGCADATVRSEGRAVATFSAQEAFPTIEDFGEGRMVDGRASVRISPDFVNVMDARADYMVFLTAEGDNRGLYVTGKTPSTFEVRECQGGRSTLAFSYRIVAKALGAPETRLPMVATQALHSRVR
jgi:hypothetical protein